MQKRESTQLKVEPLEGRVMMAFDCYMKIDGVDGEATVKGKVGYIEVDSFSWGATQIPPQNPSGGTSIKNLVVTKTLDKSTPLLAQACAKGTHIKKATLFVRKQGNDQQEYLKYNLSDCFISGYQVSGQPGAGEDRPTESLSFNYSKIIFTYDLKENKKSARDLKSGRAVTPISIKLVDPSFDTVAVDVDHDGHDDPIFFAYANLRDFNRDLLVDFVIPNDGDHNGQLDMPLLVDLNGDGLPDAVNGPIDSDGDGVPDMVLPVDVDGVGPPDMPLPVDNDHDGYVDDLILIDLNGDGKADMLAGYYTGRTDHL